MKRSYNFRFIFSLIILLVSGGIQLATAQVLTLEQAINAALEKNYDIRLARTDSASYALDNQYAVMAFIPRFNATASKVWNNNAQKQELSSGVKRDTSGLKSNNLSAAINMNWTLFDGLKMFATREKLQELETLGGLGVKNSVINTVADVINIYFGIVRQKQQLKAIEELMSISEERVTLAERKLSSGLGSKPELLQARVDLNAQKSARLQQQTLIAQLREELNQLIGFPNGEVYDVSDSIPVNTSIAYGDLINNLELTNPDLLIAKKNIDIARLTVKERRADLLPVLSFNSAYNFSRNANQAVINSFTPLFNQNRGFSYGFGLSIPILNGFNTRRLIKQAELDVQYLQLSFENRAALLNTGLTNAYKNYNLQIKLLALEEENIELARENLNIAMVRFRQGVSTNLELREAQLSLEQAYNRLIAARYNTKLAETELLRLKGDLVK
ncbi:MAG TPA: TolC family protein [Parasegetibacter sp.]